MSLATKNTDYEWFTYRAGGRSDSLIDVHGFREQVGGVLDGQTIKCFVNTFASVEDALKAFPTAKPGSRWTDPQISYNHLSDRDGDDGGCHDDY